MKQLAEAVKFAHDHRVKVYITINNLLSDLEIVELRIFLEFLQDVGARCCYCPGFGCCWSD